MYIIKYFTLVCILVVTLASTLLAENYETFLSQEEVDRIQQSETVDQEDYRDELFRLRAVIDELKMRLTEYEKTNQHLEDKLSSYKSQEEFDQLKQLKLKELGILLSSEVFSNTVNDTDYAKALAFIAEDALNAGNKYLNKFLSKQLSDYDNYKVVLPDPVELADVEDEFSDNKLSVESQAQKTYSHSAPYSKERMQDESVINTEFENALHKQRASAHFILGFVDLITVNPDSALKNFMQAYQKSDNGSIIIYSLLGIAEAYYLQDKSNEVCVALSKFNNTLQQINESNPYYTIDDYHAKQLRLLNNYANCDKPTKY